MTSRIIYVANVRMPTERAHGLQIVKMCEAFSSAGAAVTLVVPRRKNLITADPFEFYGIPKSFEIRWLPVWDLVSWGYLGYVIEAISFAFATIRIPVQKTDILFTRDIFSTLLFSFRTRNVFYEMHNFPRSGLWFWRLTLKRMRGIISTNKWKADQLILQFGFSKNRIISFPNGFDPTEFVGLSPASFRFSAERPVILYTGNLFGWKGADILARAAKILPTYDFVFIGGSPREYEDFRKKFGSYANIHLLGRRPHNEIPRYLATADILALPNSAQDPESVYSTSPIKLFEYMASGKPIVAADLPAIREIVSEEEVFFFRPDDPESLAEKMKEVFQNLEFGEGKAKAAKIKVSQYTWDHRARAILSFLVRHVSTQ
ncbi:MAG: glycosyltransferase family 4 protein [Candidatus Sungbacteria bacterium]|uniref:Glycosyltransferase family 4 protein n=1 Tax=Candidatus Sungiibacteriota bacterium TaxID=2750080 RepID=A0A9D6LQH3_9BACT|nr:glycosyltransferase family 4 protein [Candidatus Sungbacteria bacterium]